MRRQILLMSLGLLALAGCTNLSTLSNEVADGDDYLSLLSNEYLAYSLAEAEQNDWYDSEYFAKKGLKASRGMNVQPEYVSAWDVPADQEDNVASERRRLMKLVNGSARFNHAEKVAHTQVLFDCWLEQLDEQFLTSKQPVCARKFVREIASIESQILLAKPAIPSETETETASYEAVESEHTILFGFDLTELNMRGKAVVSEVSEMIKTMANYDVNVSGYADRVGPSDYNKMLSEQRAEAVVEALEENGVEVENIQLRAYGESELKVPTEDGVSEPQNRRVEIEVKGERAQ